MHSCRAGRKAGGLDRPQGCLLKVTLPGATVPASPFSWSYRKIRPARGAPRGVIARDCQPAGRNHRQRVGSKVLGGKLVDHNAT
jgi:hypothetical protein